MSMNTSTLEGFLRLASQNAEKMFNKFGEVDVSFMVEMPDGTVKILVAPEASCAESPQVAAQFRNELDLWLREYFRNNGVTRYAVIMECWIAPAGVPPAPGESISTRPDRCEKVVITAEDEARCIVAWREIIRPQGRKPLLGRLETDPDLQAMGRFMNLLSVAH